MKILHLFAAAIFLSIILAGCGSKPAAQTDTSAAPASSTANAQPEVGQRPYVVDFYATWCDPCKKLKPIFQQMEMRYGRQADFASIDVDVQQELSMRLGINALPTIIIFSDSTMSKELARVQGFAPQEIEKAILDNIQKH